MRGALAAIRHVEAVVPAATPATGVVLRYGNFYGPGTGLSQESGAPMTAVVRKRLLPVIGSGDGVWSFVHIEDAATATAAAIERGDAGIYQVVDDEPAAVRVWLPALAAALGAPAPLRLPRWLGRLLAGEAATLMMTEVRGAANARAKRALDWQLRYPTWRLGFEKGLG
jgi:nucleoside-diphosphate-sugar epimerase